MKNTQAKAREAIELIRECVFDGRYEVMRHFVKRLKQRNMVWADVLTLLDEPTDVRSDGPDPWGRPHWIVAGKATDGLPIELACSIDTDEQGHRVVLITIYWPD